MTLIGIPIRGFEGAKARLAPVLSPGQRSALARRLATHTVDVARRCADVVVVTRAADVADWADSRGVATIADRPGGLDGAADAVVGAADGGWAILHADLPLLTDDELGWALAPGDPVIAPSFDGGTTLLAGLGPFPFSYGPGSFHRHLRRMPGARVVTGPGLSLDLDRPDDLERLPWPPT